MKNGTSCAVITASDTGSQGLREDVSGKLIADTLTALGHTVVYYKIVPDDEGAIVSALKEASACARLVLTTGGTGFSKRDVTPEATAKVIEREAPGIAEAIRVNGLKFTDRAMLSRGKAGILGDCLIVNLAGSPKAVKEALDYILPAVFHGMEILSGEAFDCARRD